MTEKYKKEKVLRDLYHTKNMTQQEVANTLGTTRSAVRYWMNKHGIERRTARQDRPGSFDFNEGYARFRTKSNGSQKCVKIHRLVAVAKYGIDNVKDNIVHHKNGIKWDNRPENLELMSKSEHSSMHNKQRNFDIAEWNKEEYLEEY